MHMDGSGYEYLLCCLFPPRLIFIAIPFILADINCYPWLRHISLFAILYRTGRFPVTAGEMQPLKYGGAACRGLAAPCGLVPTMQETD